MKKRILAAMLAVALTLALALSAAPAFATSANDWDVPEGYDANDYNKIRTFFEITDENGVSNWDKFAAYTPDGHFNIDVPSTWNYYGYSFIPHIRWTNDSPHHLLSLEVSGIGFVGEMDLSNCTHLDYVDISDNQIVSLNIQGCDITSLMCKNTLLTSIDWNSSLYNFSIVLSVNGKGYVATDKQFQSNTGYEGGVHYHYICASPENGYSFVGWYDTEGNCVSTDADYNYKTSAGSDGWAESPSNTTINLTAKFVKDGDSVEPSEPTPTTEPVQPTEPSATTDPVSPTEPVAPTEPTVPTTGAISMVCIGAAALKEHN